MSSWTWADLMLSARKVYGAWCLYSYTLSGFSHIYKKLSTVPWRTRRTHVFFFLFSFLRFCCKRHDEAPIRFLSPVIWHWNFWYTRALVIQPLTERYEICGKKKDGTGPLGNVFYIDVRPGSEDAGFCLIGSSLKVLITKMKPTTSAPNMSKAWRLIELY